MKLAKSQRKNGFFFKAQTQLILIAFNAIWRSDLPEPAFSELGSHWGQRCAVSIGRTRAFRGGISLVRPRGTRFFRYAGTAWEFLLCYRAASCRKKIGQV